VFGCDSENDLLFLKVPDTSVNLVSFGPCISVSELEGLMVQARQAGKVIEVQKIGHVTGLTSSSLLELDTKLEEVVQQDGRLTYKVFIRTDSVKPFSVEGDCGSLVFLKNDMGKYRPIGQIWRTKTTQSQAFSPREKCRPPPEVDSVDEVLLLCEAIRRQEETVDQSFEWVNLDGKFVSCLPTLDIDEIDLR